MYVLLPPSETKAPDGSGPALALDRLAFPELTPVREHLLDVLDRLAADPPAARRALKVSAALEIAANGRLRTAGTLPALQRYTGVLYAALHTPPLSVPERRRAGGRILICSALFGVVGGEDLIPAYRLSAGSALPGLPGLAALWRAPLGQALAALDEPLLDLRSGAYAALAPVPHAITVRVVTRTRGGEVKPVSHDNKAAKGAFARLVATSRAQLPDVPALLRLGYRAGLSLRRTGPASLDLIAPPPRKSLAGDPAPAPG